MSEKKEEVVWLNPGQSSAQRSKLHDIVGYVFTAESQLSRLVSNQDSDISYEEIKQLEQSLGHALMRVTDLKDLIQGGMNND